MSDYVRKIGVGIPGDAAYDEKEIKVDSDHVDLSEYDESETPADSLTKKLHELETDVSDLVDEFNDFVTVTTTDPGEGSELENGNIVIVVSS